MGKEGMSKEGLRGYIVLVVLFVAFSVISIAPPFAKTGVFWIAYLFGVIAIAFQIYVFKISFTEEGDAKSQFYGFPIARVGIIYLVAQLVISLVEMLVAAFVPTWIALIINIIPVSFAVIGCIAAEAVRDEIVRQDEQIKVDVENMRRLQSISATLVGQCKDDEVRKIVQNVADEFKYSDPVTSEQTESLEMELQKQIEEIQMAVIEGDNESVKTLCSKIMLSLAERNRISKLSK